ncbi:MAG: RnfABCDGE type electron transport complex subunit D [Bacteroidales bacterium]|jgi:electron transport complex protein RnfD|nr:RnfABCDGE type electron transport complex subunit D [Bacteroidales bacterium]
MKLFTISGSPHINRKSSVKKIMLMVIISLLPAMFVSVYYFGISAIRVSLIAIASAVFFEWIIQKLFFKGTKSIGDLSAVVTGLLLAFNLPSNLQWWIVVIGSFVAIGIAKMSFGGLGKNPFNPALVGRVFLLISFPVQMTTWPKVDVLDFSLVDAETGATPLAIVKEGVKEGLSISEIFDKLPVTFTDMFWGNMGGSLGEVPVLALVIGALFLLGRRVITWHIPFSILATIGIFTGILHGINPDMYAPPLFHVLTGGIILGAFFMATDMATSPMTPKGQIIFGVGIGIITVVIRLWGAYPEGISFAILLMNALVPLINNVSKPKAFGKVKK